MQSKSSVPPKAGPSRAQRVALGAAVIAAMIVLTIVLGSAIALTGYEIGRAVTDSCFAGMVAALILFSLHPQHRALRVVVALGALGVGAVLTLVPLGRRTRLEPDEREAPTIVEVSGERRLVHRASGLSLPMPHEVTAIAGLDALAEGVEGANPNSMIVWGWELPAGALSWAMSLDRTPFDDARFREHAVNVLDGARDSGMTIDDVRFTGRVARGSGSVQGIPCRLRVDSFTTGDGDVRHWSSVVQIVQFDTADADALLDRLEVP